jgi:hypothetical protein
MAVICLTDEPGLAAHTERIVWWKTMATRANSTHRMVLLRRRGALIALGLPLVGMTQLPSSARPGAQPTPEAALIADRTRRFPLRREGGGTRAACASRLIAHLVPETGELDPGNGTLIGLIEGPTPQPMPLLLRATGKDWVLAAKRKATLRLFRLPQRPDGSLWESFPACEGTAEALAPPARSLLLRPGTRPADRPYQLLLQGLWRSCGQTMATGEAIKGWGYGHLLDRLPSNMEVVCEPLPPGNPSPQANGSVSLS